MIVDAGLAGLAAAASSQSRDPVLDLRKVVRRYGGVTAVDEVSLTVGPGEVLTLLGPSGCGKSTLLRAIAGIDRIDDGEIFIAGQLVAGPKVRSVAPERRNIGMVFQNYALWPHMSVHAHVEFPLKRAGIGRTERERRIARTLETVRLTGLERRYPGELSGGQQQRVSLARAIAADPALVLMDEPLSNLDAQLRDEMRDEIKRVQSTRRFPMVYVTHDQMEALALSDRVAVMRDGVVVQCDRPETIYRSPVSPYVARFLGACNTLRGFVTGPDRIGLRSGGVLTCTTGTLRTGDDVTVLFRPAAVTLHPNRPGDPDAPCGRVVRSSFLGTVHEHQIITDNGEELLVRTDGAVDAALVSFGLTEAFAFAPEAT